MTKEQIEDEKSVANTSLKWAGYSGAAYVLVTYILFMIFKDGRSVLWPFGFLPYAVVLLGMLFAALEKRKLLGGYITFKVAIQNTFLVLIFSLIVHGIFTYFLYNNIAPTLNVSVKHMQLEAIKKMLTMMKNPADKIEELMAPYLADNYVMTYQRIIMETFFSITKGFFWAAVIAFIVKKNPPTSY